MNNFSKISFQNEANKDYVLEINIVVFKQRGLFLLKVNKKRGYNVIFFRNYYFEYGNMELLIILEKMVK